METNLSDFVGIKWILDLDIPNQKLEMLSFKCNINVMIKIQYLLA